MFEWKNEYKEVFLVRKKHMHYMFALTVVPLGDPLFLYFSIIIVALNATLVKEEVNA